ncbi:MAG: DUF2795 domain-containing protein [Actinobacteria bacterium]|nr:DUF2795 domain-containing protein [Actinomycetota bacterium]
MTIFCNSEIMDALKNIKLPGAKLEIIDHINNNSNISEESKIALNKLEDKVYRSTDEICENIKIVCDLEVRYALSEMGLLADKDAILDYVRFRNFSEFVVRSLEGLPDGHTFNSISDICGEL